MSDVIQRLVARAQGPTEGGRALQPRPDWQLLPAVPASVDDVADPEANDNEPSSRPVSPAGASTEREQRAARHAPPSPLAALSARRDRSETRDATQEVRSARGAAQGAIRVRPSTTRTDEGVVAEPVEPSEHRPTSVHASSATATPPVQTVPGPVLPATPVRSATARPQSEAPIVSSSQRRQASPVKQDEDAIAAPAQTRQSPSPFVSPAFPPRVIPRVVLETAADDGGASVRRDSAAPGAQEPGRAAESPAVHVTIGRLEIRAPQAPQPSSGARAPRSTGLDHYLRTRAGGERR